MDVITLLSHMLGVNTGALVGYIAVIVTICNLVGRFIPDTAIGWQGTVRKICKVLGMYLGNRVAPGVSANTVATAVIGIHGLVETVGAADEVKAGIERGGPIGAAIGGAINDVRFGRGKPGLPESTPGAPKQGSAVPDGYRTDPGRSKPKIGL